MTSKLQNCQKFIWDFDIVFNLTKKNCELTGEQWAQTCILFLNATLYQKFI